MKYENISEILLIHAKIQEIDKKLTDLNDFNNKTEVNIEYKQVLARVTTDRIEPIVAGIEEDLILKKKLLIAELQPL